MRKPCRSRAAVVGMAAALALAASVPASGQELRGPLQIRAAASADMAALRRFDALVETLTAGGELALVSSQPDGQLPGRMHQYFQQYHDGVPVYGAGVSRQQAGGATVSILGTIETGIELDVVPRFQSAEALELLEQQAGAGVLTSALPELVIVQKPSGRHVLAYRATMRDLRTYFLDAHSGFIAHDVSAVETADRGLWQQAFRVSARSSARRRPAAGTRRTTACAPPRSSPSTCATTSSALLDCFWGQWSGRPTTSRATRTT